MKLSIIVPVYNMMAGGKLENCLNSLINQDVQHMEIIAVDDKSTDDSLNLLEQFSQKYGERFITIASPENKRQGGAKNLGLERAKGEWIGFIDSDDWVSADMFSKLLKKAEETGADIVGCDYLLTEEIGKEEGIVEVNNTCEQTGILGDEQYKALILNPGSMVIKIYKRTLFTEHSIRFPEKIRYEDVYFAFLAIEKSEKYEYMDIIYYLCNNREDSSTTKYSLEQVKDTIKLIEKLFELYDKIDKSNFKFLSKRIMQQEQRANVRLERAIKDKLNKI